jgi:hypothetical protein
MRGITFFPTFVFYYRYASLYFCCAIEDQDNELITLEIIHRYVELLDKYFGSVSSSLFFIFSLTSLFGCLEASNCRERAEITIFHLSSQLPSRNTGPIDLLV